MREGGLRLRRFGQLEEQVFADIVAKAIENAVIPIHRPRF
jgi:hypothetical protein